MDCQHRNEKTWCYFCRKTAYAKACVQARTTCHRWLLTRWQGWCVPLLSNFSVWSAVHVFALIKDQLSLFSKKLGSYVTQLSRAGADLSPRNFCVCASNSLANKVPKYESNRKQPREQKVAATIKFNIRGCKVSRWWKNRQCRWVGKSRKTNWSTKLCCGTRGKSRSTRQKPCLKTIPHLNVSASWSHEVVGKALKMEMERAIPQQRHLQGGGPDPSGKDDSADRYLSNDETQQLVVACLFSKAGSWQTVTTMMQQKWVSEWNGWQELQENPTEQMCMQVAARLYNIGSSDVPTTIQTNAAALQRLEADGLSMQRAQSYGMNNCLIDSLILSLCASGLLPCDLAADWPKRRQLTVRCRDTLAKEIGPLVQATPGEVASHTWMRKEMGHT